MGQRLGVTWRYGDEDLWHFFNSAEEVDWIVVRDHRLDLVYYGKLQNFSSSKQPRELVLSGVSVYSNVTGEHLYDVPLMYFSREPNELTVETIPGSDEGV